jgi:hypothetical protein
MKRYPFYRFLLISGMMLTGMMTATAQPGKRLERIEAAKVSYLTERMNLTPDQAKAFWPLYNEFDDQRRDLKRKSKIFKDEQLEALSDEQVRDGLTQMMDFRQKEVNLEKTYLEKFLKVIPPRQVAIMFKSEKEFMRLLLQKLDNRKHGNGPGPKSGLE